MESNSLLPSVFCLHSGLINIMDNHNINQRLRRLSLCYSPVILFWGNFI